MSGRTPHPADLRDARRIAAAVRFAVHFRKSPGDVIRIECATLGEARAEAVRLDRAHGSSGRRAGVYAIGPDAVATFVPATYRQED
jgi:hypothetical protein